MSDFQDTGAFFGDLEEEASPYVRNSEHEAIGLHLPGQNILAPELSPDCISGNSGDVGLSDALSREDHAHNVRARIIDHEPDDGDFEDPKPGILAFNELDSTMYVRGTVVWFSWTVTPLL